MKQDKRSTLSNSQWIVFVILAISILLRWALVVRGGQFYFPDEHRYQTSQDVAGFLLQGRFHEAITTLFHMPEHLGFKIIGILPALVEHVVRPSLVIPALFFSLFSVLNLYLIYLLAQRMGASQYERLLALGIAASSQSLLYYSRHLMPYDTAMTFGLLSLWVALQKQSTLKTSLLCGAFGFLCFLTYNGYWTLVTFAMVCHLFVGEKRLPSVLQRGLLLATGFAIPFLLVVASAKLAGINLLTEYATFAGTVNQGEFSEGWSLPFEYFWHTEHFLIFILGLLFFYSVFHVFKHREWDQLYWVTGVVFVYGSLLVFSVFFHSFVVLGRLARQMLPFLILLSAHGLAQFSVQKPSTRYVGMLILAFIVLQGFWNYGNSFMLSYPREFSTQAQVQYPDFEFSQKRMAFGAPTVCQYNGYIMENAKYFLDAPETEADIQGTVLLAHSHPINFLPYQYEGYKPAQRQGFRRANLRMVLYKVDMEFMSASNPEWVDIKNCAVNENPD
jgi:hypothetical protein